jgi:phage anti-repressor protein
MFKWLLCSMYFKTDKHITLLQHNETTNQLCNRLFIQVESPRTRAAHKVENMSVIPTALVAPP